MEISQRYPHHHDEHSGGLVQPDLRTVHHHLHLRCDGYAAVWQGLHEQRVSLGWVRNAALELHRFHAQVAGIIFIVAMCLPIQQNLVIQESCQNQKQAEAEVVPRSR